MFFWVLKVVKISVETVRFEFLFEMRGSRSLILISVFSVLVFPLGTYGYLDGDIHSAVDKWFNLILDCYKCFIFRRAFAMLLDICSNFFFSEILVLYNVQKFILKYTKCRSGT